MIVIISGPSSCGKSTIIKLLEQKYGLVVAHSTVTRPMRPNEKEGDPYYFVTNEQFDKMIAEDKFFEWNSVHEKSNRYGLEKKYIEQAKNSDVCMIKEVDVEGQQEYIKKLKEWNVKTLSVYIRMTTDLMRERLEKRGDEAGSIETRLSRCAYENGFADNYDIIIDADNSDDCSERIAKQLSETIAQLMQG